MLYLVGADGPEHTSLILGSEWSEVAATGSAVHAEQGLLAKLRVMYWKEIPVQVQAEDGSGPVSKLLHERFQRGVDSIAISDGSGSSDEYLLAWSWGEYTDFDGSAEEAVTKLAERFNNGFPKNFVARILALQRSGKRDPSPGAVDNWVVDCV